MDPKTQLPRSCLRAAVGLAVLSLVFLGSPGCGCGDDDLTPPGGDRGERCCCDFEWLPPSNVVDRDVRLVISNEGDSLDATITPSLLTDVSARELETFTVCVNDDHVIGHMLELGFVDDATNVEYGSVLLMYKSRCQAAIEPLTGDIQLTSPDCGGQTLQCCCDFEWLPGPNQVGDVTVVAANVSAGLNPVISPSSLTGVGPDAIELFTICVDANHTLGAMLDLEIRQQGTNALVGAVQLVYDATCTPTVVPISAAPTLNLTSTTCGGSPLLCCCTFDWIPGPNGSGDVAITAENPSTGLTVQITPSTLTGVSPNEQETFTVCINGDHALLDTFDLVITRTSDSQQFGRARFTYRLRCTPDVADVPGTPSLILLSDDCGVTPSNCCCQVTWFAPTAWNPPPGPWTATLENVGATLVPATVTPTTIDTTMVPTEVVFDVCVNPAHTDNDGLTLVIRDSSGREIHSIMMWWYDCLPLEYAPSSTGEGFWSVDCLQLDKPGR